MGGPNLILLILHILTYPNLSHLSQWSKFPDVKQRDRDDLSLHLVLALTLVNLPLPYHLHFQLFHRHAQLQSRPVSRFIRRTCIAERSERPAERGHDVGSPSALAKRFHHAENNMRVPLQHTIVWCFPSELLQTNLDRLVLAQHPSSIYKLRKE